MPCKRSLPCPAHEQTVKSGKQYKVLIGRYFVNWTSISSNDCQKINDDDSVLILMPQHRASERGSTQILPCLDEQPVWCATPISIPIWCPHLSAQPTEKRLIPASVKKLISIPARIRKSIRVCFHPPKSKAKSSIHHCTRLEMRCSSSLPFFDVASLSITHTHTHTCAVIVYGNGRMICFKRFPEVVAHGASSTRYSACFHFRLNCTRCRFVQFLRQ